MSDVIRRIANLMSEDIDDPLSDYHDKWERKTVLSDDTYFRVIAILKNVCKNNGCILDHRKLAVEFIPPGFIIKNVYIDCPSISKKKELIARLADQTGDDTVKHTFDDNLRVNLYNSLNKEFANKVRDELDLDVTHQFLALPPGSKRLDHVETLPMITVTTPKVAAEEEEELEGFDEPMELGEFDQSETEDLPPLSDLGAFSEPDLGPDFMDEDEEETEEERGPGVKGPSPEEIALGRTGREDEEDLISIEDINYIANIISEDLL